MIGRDEFVKHAETPQVHGDGELNGIQCVQAMSQAVELEELIGLLKVSGDEPHDCGPALAEVGKEPSPQEAKVRSREVTAPHFPGKDRHAFYHR
jgi:hypothetical protein